MSLEHSPARARRNAPSGNLPDRSDDDDRLLTPAEVAAKLGVKEQTLARARWSGDWELPFVKLANGLCRYRRRDVLAFIERGLRTSTSAGRNAA